MDLRKPNVLVNTKGLSRSDWLRCRKLGIGGSDAAALLGLSQYSSPLSVWADKVSADVPEDEEEITSESAWRGNVLEEPIARRYARQSGLNIVRCNQMLQHPDYPWMLANIDRRVKGQRIGVEIKSVSPTTKYDFEGGEIDPRFYCQCMHYLAVTGWDKWILVVWVVDRGLYDFEITPNMDEINTLIEVEKEFWQKNVVLRVMPPVDGTEASADALKLSFPASNNEMMTLDCEDDITRYLVLDAQVKVLEAEREIAKQKIQQRMGNFEVGVTANYTVKWKSGKPVERFDKKRFAAEMPELYQKYLKAGSPVRRFEVKESTKED